MATTNTNDTEDLSAQLAQLRADFAALGKEIKALTEARAESMAARAAERVVALKSAGERQVEKATKAARDVASEAGGMIQAHPAATIAASAALGFLIGALTARRG